MNTTTAKGGPKAAATVSVTPASEAERTLIEGLMQFYIYDFSEMEPVDSAAFEFDSAGRFPAYPHLDAYWRDEKRWPVLIRATDRIVGFALINTLSHRGGTIDRNMAEFFITRKHRRHGIAADAFHQILRAHPGRWEVAIAERNFGAKTFWPRAIETAPNVGDIVRHEGDGKTWRGPIYTFRAA